MQKEAVVKTLQELYKNMGLPADEVSSPSGFTVHFLQDTFKELPFTSVAFRPDYFSFLFVKEGQGRYTIDDMTFPIEPGTVYFTNPGNYRTFEWHAITDVCLITFNESYLKEYVHHDVYNDFSFLLTETIQPRILPADRFEDMEQLYRRIYKEHHTDSPYQNKIIGSLFVVLLLKIKEYFWQDYNPIYEGNRNSQIVKQFKRLLEDHYKKLVAGKAEKILRVQDYADAQSLHPNYLSTVIKTKTGKAVSTWVAEKTIAAARSLLQHTDISIKEIAYRLGFEEPAHFSNYFKKHTNTTPVIYRREHNSSAS